MKCIVCGIENQKLAKSHIVPNFVRKRLTGETDKEGNKKFKFKWIGRQDLPKQDLPKPYLMCKKCDNDLGAKVEKEIAPFIMPDRVDDMDSWDSLNIYIDTLDKVKVSGSPFHVGKYRCSNSEELMLNKFSMSVAWRALHAMSIDGMPLSTEFIKTERGEKINSSAVSHIFNDEPPYDLYKASLYYLGPKSASFITNKIDEYPFGWVELGSNQSDLGIAVIFGCWVIIWPLGSGGMAEYYDHLDSLEIECFESWLLQVKSALASA
ncbi:hypothetical protein BCT19_24685 [Vibrio splendidus]|uniref:hypothetical protein n=1 Tax=Vibrio splendidus TaxID=29497 RepID=UPI000C86014F|nr:hypothetical protein [Vibrio splendidus]PMN98001.1 hypothetical protein BCT19_24685 [Vibrio splendidus]